MKNRKLTKSTARKDRIAPRNFVFFPQGKMENEQKRKGQKNAKK